MELLYSFKIELLSMHTENIGGFLQIIIIIFIFYGGKNIKYSVKDFLSLFFFKDSKSFSNFPMHTKLSSKYLQNSHSCITFYRIKYPSMDSMHFLIKISPKHVANLKGGDSLFIILNAFP